MTQREGLRIALVGRPYSGKTTLAHALAQQGFGVINFTDEIKRYTLAALNAWEAMIHPGQFDELTVEDIHRDKEYCRPLLRAVATHLGFDQGFAVDSLVEDAIADFGWGKSLVFDNVRFPAQADILKRYGFVIVGVRVSAGVVSDRSGLTIGETHDLLADDDHGVDEDIAIDGTKPVAENVRILCRLAGIHYETPSGEFPALMPKAA